MASARQGIPHRLGVSGGTLGWARLGAVNSQGSFVASAIRRRPEWLSCSTCRLERDSLVAAYGEFGGAWRYSLYRVLFGGKRDYPKGVRGLEGFSVSPECRGKGIGAAMIDRIVRDARAEGARAIELNVGDSNPARHLYEREGFVQTRTGGVGPFAGRLGFKRFVYYELEL